jgi:predicted nucleotidyltransferase
MISQDKIQEATKRLVDAYNPVAIYLFGSYAWGQPTEDSDLDLMVILSDEEKVEWTSFRKGVAALWNMDFSKDILVNSQSEFLKRAIHPSTLQHKIQIQGIKLYESTRRMAFQS